jgi:hypothetical protein
MKLDYLVLRIICMYPDDLVNFIPFILGIQGYLYLSAITRNDHF